MLCLALFVTSKIKILPALEKVAISSLRAENGMGLTDIIRHVSKYIKDNSEWANLKSC